MKPLPLYIKFLLWFKRSYVSYDIETAKSTIYFVKFKFLFGVTYVIEEGQLLK